MNLKIFDEPLLEFANGQRMGHPRDGLTLFGPVDSMGVEKPRHVRYGLLGTPEGVTEFHQFIQRMQQPTLTDADLDDVLWPHFPGFEEAFHSVWPKDPVWEQPIDADKLKAVVRDKDAHARVYGVTDLYLEAIHAANRSDNVCDLFICVVPEIVWTNCRPLSRVKDGTGHSVTRKEQHFRSAQPDMFGDYNPDQYAFSVDFRRQIKARVMEHNVPIQIIRQSTLRLVKGEFGERQLTPLSDRLWNLGTTLYYKSGCKPWKLSTAREGVCYVGVAFKKTEDQGRNACCAAQMFLDDGDGVVFLGDEGRWYSEEDGQYHLSRDAAKRLLAGILKTYDDQHGKPLKEVFLHCRSSLNESEYAGYLDACPAGVKLTGIRVAPDRSGLRLYRTGTRPVLRGSFWRVSDKHGYLYGSGFKPRLRTYDGSEVPVPLAVTIQHGEGDLEQVAKDILGLTKLNYNACKLGEFQPVTIRFSDEVGEILVANRRTKNIKPNFKFYI